MAEQKSARTLMKQEPGRGKRHSIAADTPNIANRTNPRQTGAASYQVRNGTDPAFFVTLKGRPRWALERLRKAGLTGCTPITEPGPRWSAYVADLRELGFHIETIREAHGGAYPGHHGRYVLRSIVTRADGGAA